MEEVAEGTESGGQAECSRGEEAGTETYLLKMAPARLLSLLLFMLYQKLSAV